MNYILFIATVLIIAVLILFLKSIRLPMTLRKIDELLAEGNLKKASDLLKRVSLKKKEFPPVRFLRAKLLTLQGQYIMAISELNSILSAGSFKKYLSELEIRYSLAELYAKTKNYAKEVDEYKEIIAIDPSAPKANQRVGYVLYTQGDFANAKEYLLKSVLLSPELVELYLPLGVSAYKSGDYSHAEEFLIKSLDVSKDKTEAQYYLGSIYKMKKDYENAISMLEKSYTNKKFFLESCYTLGQIYFEKESFANAIEVLEKGIKKLKKNGEDSLAYRYLLAESYELENKIKEAVFHWKKIAEENPNYRSTQLKIDAYGQILENEILMAFFQSSIEEMQPYITDIISGLNFNIISQDKISSNEYQYRVHNIKRINEPPVLVLFNRTTREISEGQIVDLTKRMNNEKCKAAIYITTSRFSLRAKNIASSKMIDLYDYDFVCKTMEKIKSRKKFRK